MSKSDSYPKAVTSKVYKDEDQIQIFKKLKQGTPFGNLHQDLQRKFSP